MGIVQESLINLRNDIKTWCTNNFILKANKSDLTASNGTIFQFGVDGEGNYGYIVNGITIPFNGGIDISEIEVFNATSGAGSSIGSITRNASLTLKKGKYIIYANGEAASGYYGYTDNYYITLTVGGTSVGTEIFKYLTGDHSIRAVSKYYICEIPSDNTSVTATFYSNTFSNGSDGYSIWGSVGLHAFKLG